MREMADSAQTGHVDGGGGTIAPARTGPPMPQRSDNARIPPGLARLGLCIVGVKQPSASRG
jgi:hypothetical protein